MATAPFFGPGLGQADDIFLRILKHNRLSIEPQDLRWILRGENHLSTFRKYPQGCFTIRVVTNGHRPTLRQSVERDGKTHGLFLFSQEKRETESMELVLDAYWVDLKICLRMLQFASEWGKVNRADSNKYVIFNPNDEPVQLFCRRLKLPPQ